MNTQVFYIHSHTRTIIREVYIHAYTHKNLDRLDKSVWYIYIYTHTYMRTYRYIEERIKSRCQVAVAIKFCTVAPNIYGSSKWNAFHITLLVPEFWYISDFFWKSLHLCIERPVGWTNMPPQTSTIIPTLPYPHHPKDKTLTFLHSKECLCPALCSNFKTRDVEVLSCIRTGRLHWVTDSLPACCAAGIEYKYGVGG